MLAAVVDGDAKKLAKLMGQDPGFNVNKQDGSGVTLLHEACFGDGRSPVSPLLLAHPDIDVNAKNIYGGAPFTTLVTMDTPPVFVCCSRIPE